MNGIISAAEMKDKYQKALSSVNWEYREWWLNFAYVRGRQWVRWDTSTDRIVPINRVGQRYQATVNKLQPAINTTVSTIMHDPLVFEVPPQAADDFAMQGAQTAEAILADKNLKAGWNEKKEELLWATIMGGYAGLAVEWDDAASWYGPEIKTGDCVETVLSAPEFVVEPVSKKAREARWWMKAQVLNPEEVQAKFKLPKPPPADALTGGPFHQRILPTPDTRMNQSAGCLVLTYYERPNYLRKQGCVSVMVNNQIVWGPEPWPFPFKDHLNLSVSKALVVPGKWTGDAYMSAARSIQTQLNFVWTNIHENTKALGANKLLLPYGASDVEQQLDDDPAHPIRYPEGVEKPAYLSPAIVPPHIINQVQMLENEIADIMGVHAISSGQTPTNAPDSGYGLQLLAEKDQTPMGRLAKEISRAMGEMASTVLELYADRVTDKRKASVYRRGSPVSSYSWRGKDIEGQTTAIVPSDSLMSTSKAARQKFAENLLQMRPDWFPNFSAFASAAMLPEDEMLWRLDADTKKAMYENQRMAEQEIIIPEDFDNHTKHIQTHNDFRKTPKYMSMSEKDREIIDKHVAAHVGMAQEEAGMQAAKSAMHPALGSTPTAQEVPPLPGAQMQPPQQPNPGQIPA